MTAFLEAIAGPLATALAFFYGFVPNIGISIILLTLLINLVLFPLTLKQTRASRAFAGIQPQVRELQAKYKDDPQTMQKEMVRVQRESGATPGGCLGPMLVQMPIWFALFRMLRDPLLFVPESSTLHAAIAAGKTGFLGMNLIETPAQAWQSGFVAILPYAVAILIMIGAQYFQQVQAQSGQQDTGNAQAQTMQNVTKMMPIVFGVIAVQFQAGLIVYWATSNLFRFGQQAVIYRIDGRPSHGQAEAKDSPADTETPAAPKRQQGAAKKRNRRRRS